MFDIYFQSGEFVGENGGIWKDFIWPFLGSATPLGIYFLGMLNERRKDRVQKAEFDTQKLQFLAELVKNSLKFSRNLESRVDKLITDLRPCPTELPKLGYYSSFEDLRRLVSGFNREEAYYAYVNQLPDKNINTLFRLLDTLYYTSKELFENYEELSNANFKSNEIIDIKISEVYSKINNIRDLPWRERSQRAKIKQVYSNLARIKEGLNKYEIIRDKFLEPIIQDIGDDSRFGPQWDSVKRSATEGYIQIKKHLEDRDDFIKILEGKLTGLKRANNAIEENFEPLRLYIETLPIAGS